MFLYSCVFVECYFFLHVFSGHLWGQTLDFPYRNEGDSVDVLEICSVWDSPRRFLSFCFRIKEAINNVLCKCFILRFHLLCMIRKWRRQWSQRQYLPLIMVVRSTWWSISLRKCRSQSEPRLISSPLWAVRLDYIITTDDLITFGSQGVSFIYFIYLWEDCIVALSVYTNIR